MFLCWLLESFFVFGWWTYSCIGEAFSPDWRRSFSVAFESVQIAVLCGPAFIQALQPLQFEFLNFFQESLHLKNPALHKSKPIYWSALSFQGNSRCTSSNLKTILQYPSASLLADYFPIANSKHQHLSWASQSSPSGWSSPPHSLSGAATAPESFASFSVSQFDNQTNSVHILKFWLANISTPPSSWEFITLCFL